MSGVMTFSMEIELGWGLHDLPNYKDATKSISEKRQKETRALESLLDICDKYQIPISFDVVGHLFYNKCRGDHSGPHEEGWFKRDPGTDVDTDPWFYAPDLVKMVQDSKTEHEICTHTFSHIPCGEFREDVVDWELKKVIEIHEDRLGKAPVSLVPPRHSPPQRDILRNNGIEVIRMPSEDKKDYSKIKTFMDGLLGSHPVVDPEINEGVVESYSTPKGSLNFNAIGDGSDSPHFAYRCIPMRVRKRLHKRYFSNAMKETIEKQSFSHFWTHLNDISNQDQLDTVLWFLERVADHKAKGDIEVLTMEELNSEIRDND